MRNLIDHPVEWKDLMGNCGGKGYLEFKNGQRIKMQGNIFSGCDGLTITTRNQSGADPWNDLDDLDVSYNWFKSCNAPFTLYGSDGANLTNRIKNARFHNNVCENVVINDPAYSYLQPLSNWMTGADGLTVTNNTMLVGKYRFTTSLANAQERITGMVNKNNIFMGAPAICFNDGSATQGLPITSCWPGAQVAGNVFIKVPEWTYEQLNETWFSHYPNNSVAPSLQAIEFANPDLSGTSLDNYRLLSTSPYYRKGTDGKDPGADIDALKQAIFSNSPPPLPTPTPSASPSPTATPTPSPTVTPTPTPNPTPTPTPVPTPIPTPTPTPTPNPTPSPTPTPTPAPVQLGDVVWVDDSVPMGAISGGDGEFWNWIRNSPLPFSGGLANQSAVAPGMHQHYFVNATGTLKVNPGDTLIAYVFIDPANIPSQIMLQWNDGDWEHRAYWGTNNLNLGADNTNSRRRIGPLPPAGQWVRLEVPANQVGLNGKTVNGMSFTLYGGRATWDRAGKNSRTGAGRSKK